MLQVTKIHEGGEKEGFLYSLVVDGPNVYGCGGTWYKPTLLASTDHGRTFAAWKTPQTPGLRDVCVEGKKVWVAGEYGMVASTTNQGKTWTKVKVPGGEICLYQIARDAGGALWILGDNGLVVRRTNNKFVTVKNHSKGRMLKILFDPLDGAPWLLDDPGYLQRWTGKRFVLVPIGKVRNKQILTCIARTRAKTLILTGDNGLLLRSSNDGKTWKPAKIKGKQTAALEHIHITKYGIFIVGGEGTLLVSHDDGLTWTKLKTTMKKINLWSFADVEAGLLIGADGGLIFRIDTSELATLLRDAYRKDAVLSALASRVHENEPGAEMVLEDALRERDLWG